MAMQVAFCAQCGSRRLLLREDGSVRCDVCGVEFRIDQVGDGADDHIVKLAEHPEIGGASFTLHFGNEELVVVEYCHEDYIATMRGALTLIGGMRTDEALAGGDDDGEDDDHN